eukprot:GHVL01034833.1.p1 GENE.GHVL01034833.1~~GHVL01034833.1.p1  ORF type:complete len:229 (-),score=44.06 GHVL01034833.1:111-737(-)
MRKRGGFGRGSTYVPLVPVGSIQLGNNINVPDVPYYEVKREDNGDWGSKAHSWESITAHHNLHLQNIENVPYKGTMNDVFCEICGSILMPSQSDATMICLNCGRREGRSAYPTTKIYLAAYPMGEYKCNILKTKKEREAYILARNNDQHRLFAEEEAEQSHRSTIKESCPQCNNDTMQYWTMQLRSADEGQTVFYKCPKCEFTSSVNT